MGGRADFEGSGSQGRAGNAGGDGEGGVGGSQGGGGGGNEGSLEAAIPGVPGDDYPIYAETPETSFICDDKVSGGYYADPETECQVFHICVDQGRAGNAKYSFLCPNGTIFNQEVSVCDWWFNVDCSLAEELYSIQDENAAEREANTGSGSQGSDTGGGQGRAGGSNQQGGYKGSQASSRRKGSGSSARGGAGSAVGSQPSYSGGRRQGSQKTSRGGAGQRGGSSALSQAGYEGVGQPGFGGDQATSEIYGAPADQDAGSADFGSSSDSAREEYGAPGGFEGNEVLSGYNNPRRKNRRSRQLDSETLLIVPSITDLVTAELRES